MSTWLAWVPYLLVAVILVLTRLPELGIGSVLKAFAIQWPGIFDTEITGKSQPLYLPGSILVAVVMITYFLHRMKFSELRAAIGESSKILLGAGFVLIFTVPMVRIYINSGVNALDLPSMPVAMAQWVAYNVGNVWSQSMYSESAIL